MDRGDVGAGGHGGERREGIVESLVVWGIPRDAYEDMIRGLFIAAGKDRAPGVAQAAKWAGRAGRPTTVMRTFRWVRVVAEDRGSVYAVWISRINDKGVTQGVIQFAEIPWEEF